MKTYLMAIAIGLFLSLTTLFAQTPPPDSTATTPPRWAIQLNTQHQDLLYQIQYGQLGVTDPVNIRPLYSIDFQRFYAKNIQTRRFLSGQIGMYNNLYHERWISFKIGYGVEQKIGKRLFGSLRMEGGMALVRNTDVRYQYEDGKWVEAKGDSPLYADIVLGPRMDFGYRVGNTKNPIDIIATANLTLHLNPRVGGIPYYGIGLGVRYGF